MGFFDKPQGAAIFKHAVLKGYTAIFVSKVGSRSLGHRVVILDGYAGPGRYDDGSPGSPAVALATAEALRGARDVCCHFVEENPRDLAELSAMVANSGLADRVRIWSGDVSTHLPGLLAEIGNAPLFAFLDPFGLGIAFDHLTQTIMKRPGTAGRRPATEILVNFIYPAVYRNAGKLRIQSDNPVQQQSARTIVKLVDDNLGGAWWHEIWLGSGGTGDKVRAIREEYVARVLAAAGPSWRCYAVPVADVWQGKAIYELLLFSQHVQGPWFFNEAVSNARMVFKEHLAPHEANLMQLWDPEDELQDRIAKNLYDELRAGRSVALAQQYELVYGDTLGYARGTHVRKAIKKLHQEGLTSTSGKGDLHTMVVQPAVPAPSPA